MGRSIRLPGQKPELSPKRTLTPEERRRRLRRRLWVYGSIIAALTVAYKFQPIEIDFVPRKLPPKSTVDPDSKQLFSRGTRVMVVVAHPDDSEFYIAGTLFRLQKSGAEVRQLLLTDGDKAYYFWADNSKLRATRQAEQREASAQWGAKELRFLGYDDGRLRTNEDTIRATAKVIEEWKPNYILCFDGRYPPRASHQDHRRAGDIAEAAATKAGFKGWVLEFGSMAPNFVVDVDPVWAERIASIAIHKSQFTGAKLERIQSHLADSAVEQGEPAGFAFGEAFRCLQYKE